MIARLKYWWWLFWSSEDERWERWMANYENGIPKPSRQLSVVGRHTLRSSNVSRHESAPLENRLPLTTRNVTRKGAKPLVCADCGTHLITLRDDDVLEIGCPKCAGWSGLTNGDVTHWIRPSIPDQGKPCPFPTSHTCRCSTCRAAPWLGLCATSQAGQTQGAYPPPQERTAPHTTRLRLAQCDE